jgi:hypothetical protein
MSPKEGSAAGVEERDRRAHFRADSGKANLSPPEAAAWFELVPVDLANGDSVAVVVPWKFPGPLDGVTIAHMHQLRAAVAQGSYRKSALAKDWVGNALADVLGLDVEADAAKLKSILKIWFKNGVLREEIRKDEYWKDRKFVVPGSWDENIAPG